MSSKVEELPPSFTTAEVLEHGVSWSTLYRLRDRGEVVELSRGAWRRADAPPTPHEGLLAVALRAPHGAVCLLSALAFHQLTDEIPSRVDLAVPRGQHRPKIDYPPVEVYVFDADTFELGRAWVEVAPDERVPIYDEVRSTVDALRLRNQLGTDIAYGAARRLLARRRRTAGELLDVARELRCAGPVGDTLEVLQA
jgi:predicted transcriptional regulator of viral defense system